MKGGIFSHSRPTMPGLIIMPNVPKTQTDEFRKPLKIKPFDENGHLGVIITGYQINGLIYNKPEKLTTAVIGTFYFFWTIDYVGIATLQRCASSGQWQICNDLYGDYRKNFEL